MCALKEKLELPLYLVAVEQMLLYFFESSHVNYARYDLHYLRSVENIEVHERRSCDTPCPRALERYLE